jgi:hypothetical protein
VALVPRPEADVVEQRLVADDRAGDLGDTGRRDRIGQLLQPGVEPAGQVLAVLDPPVVGGEEGIESPDCSDRGR